MFDKAASLCVRFAWPRLDDDGDNGSEARGDGEENVVT